MAGILINFQPILKKVFLKIKETCIIYYLQLVKALLYFKLIILVGVSVKYCLYIFNRNWTIQ